MPRPRRRPMRVTPSSTGGTGSAGKSGTRAVLSAVLTDAAATALVTATPTERRAVNAAYNAVVPTAGQLTTYLAGNAAEPQFNANKVTGDSGGTLAARLGRTPTTDEWIQWAAWKWGISEDLIRAVGVQESDWRHTVQGDFVTDSGPAHYTGYESFGITQVKATLNGAPNHGWAGTYPLSKDSTSFNLDYYGRSFRAAYDGLETWLGGSYTSGDEYGCVGYWFSGDWYDTGAVNYANSVYGWLSARTWETYTG